MKPRQFLVFAVSLCLLIAPASPAGEIRKIGDTEVDLQPLVDWSAKKKKGDRPLKHWKFVQVLDFKRQSTYPVFRCDIEGLKAEIMLKNCPSELVKLAEQKTNLQKELDASRGQQEGAYHDLGNAANRRQLKQAKREAAAAQKDSKVVHRELESVNTKLKQQKVLAMATGTSMGGVPVWDTGLKAR